MYYNQIKKFYNADAAEVQTAAPETQTSPAPDVQPVNSIASLMARHGVKSDGGQTVEIPVVNIEQKPEVKKEETQTPVETTNVTAEPPKTEGQVQETPKTEVKAPETTPIETKQEAQPQVSWQEVLKQQQPETVLKELGYDDKLVNFVNGFKDLDEDTFNKMQSFFNHWKSNGDVTTYLKELTTDYTKMSAEDVMRHQLRKDYPKASDQQLDILFKREVVKAYNLDSDDEEEVKEGMLLLEAKADRYREEFARNQQNFLLAKAPEPQKPEQANLELQLKAEQERQERFDLYKNQITGNPYTQAVFANKFLPIGEGEEKFNFPVEPQVLTDILLDSDKWASSFFNVEEKNGQKVYTPDVEKQLFVAAAMNDYKGLLKELAKHYKALGGKSVIEPIENITVPNNSQPAKSEAPPSSVAEAMAKFGRVV